MELNVNDSFFAKARPIWAKELTEEKNINLGLYKKISYEKGKAVLRVAVSGFYKVFLNGEFLHFDPARCAHGYYRVYEIELPLKKGENHIAIETVNYYVNSFYSLMQKGFIEAELTLDGEVLVSTGVADEKAFGLLRLNERIRKVQHYSFQRPFAEAYNLSEDYCGWRVGENGENASEVETVTTESKRLLPRNIPLNEFTKAFPDCKVGTGRVKTGVKPKRYRKDRSLIYIKDPASGNLEGYYKFELTEHLSDEVQEFCTEKLSRQSDPYSGRTSISSKEFKILFFLSEKNGIITVDINCLSDSTLYFLFDEVLTENGDIDPLRLECCNVIKINLKRGNYRFMSAERRNTGSISSSGNAERRKKNRFKAWFG